MATRSVRVIVVAAALAAGLGWTLLERALWPKPPLAVLGKIPPFHLVDERGVPFGVEAMVGHVSVVDFIFTRCASSCPRLTARMTELQGLLSKDKSGARLVSFSVDPENDTPTVLAEYAAQAHADPSRWSFVTGEVQEVERAAVNGFKVSVQKIARDAGDYDVVHGEWFVLVDAAAQVRGYYSVQTPADLDPLANDVKRLEAHL
jgi:protein SCO1/2